MPAKAKAMKMLMVAALMAIVLQSAEAAGEKASKIATPVTRTTSVATPKPADAPDARTVLEGAANALRMLRPQKLADGRAPLLDLTNTIEFWASGMPFSDFHATLSYNPPGMRVE